MRRFPVSCATKSIYSRGWLDLTVKTMLGLGNAMVSNPAMLSLRTGLVLASIAEGPCSGARFGSVSAS